MYYVTLVNCKGVVVVNFIKESLSLPYEKVVTDLGEEHVYTIPKSYKYMSEVFNTLPDNSFLCKSVAGVGGTSLAITNSEDYVIAVGSVELIINKAEQHDNLIPVYGDVTSLDIENAVSIKRLTKQPIKIIVTYDSLPRVVDVLGASVATTKLLVDELQVLLKASDTFKPVVVTKLFRLVDSFKSVCFMTATPTPRKYFPPEVAKLDYIRLEWKGSSVMHIKKAKMKGDVASKVVAIALHHLDTEGTPLFFYNSLRGIVPCVKQLIKARGLTHKDIKIICADNDRNRTYLKEQLGKDWIPERPLYKEVVDNIVTMNPRNKPIQFCTKYAFEGLDFCVEDAHTYIISDVKNRSKHHTRIDISTDIQQIAGRCRNQNPLVKREAVFLWNDEFTGASLSEDEYEDYVKNELEIAKDMEQRYTISKLKDMKIDFNSSPYFLEVDGKAQTNDYAVYGLCISYAALNADYVNVMVDDGKTVLEGKLELFSETDNYDVPDIKLEDLAKMDKKLNFKDLAMEYYELNEHLIQRDGDCKETLNRMEVLLSLDGEFKSYVDVLGIDEIKSTYFHKTKTKAKYNKAVGVDEKTVKQKKALKTIRLKNNTFYSFAELKEKVKYSYEKLKVSGTPKATDIQNLYLVKSTARNGVRGYLVVGKV